MEYIVFGVDLFPTGDLGVLFIFACVLLGMIKQLMVQADDRKACREFLVKCTVAHEIRSIKYQHSGYLYVLAERTDGKYGITNGHGWANVGQGQYIARKWKEYTGNYPYIKH